MIIEQIKKNVSKIFCKANTIFFIEINMLSFDWKDEPCIRQKTCEYFDLSFSVPEQIY